jgi:hypothetical protein
MNVKAPIKSLYLLKAPLAIEGCVISREKENMTVSTTVKAENEISGKKIALTELDKSFYRDHWLQMSFLILMKQT